MVKSRGEETLAAQLKIMRIDGWVREYRFHPERRWRLDFAWPERTFAVEIEGGIWTGGRHTRGKGFLGDEEKYAEAMLLGWTVYRCSTDTVTSGHAIGVIERMLA